MFAIPFICSPLTLSIQTYKSTKFKHFLVIRDGQSVKRVDQGSREFELHVSTLYGRKIKSELQPFFDKVGIRKDLIVSEEIREDVCAAGGTNYFTKGDAVIYVAPYLNEQDMEACHWLVKHETSHIKNNDYFTTHLVPAICSIAAAIFSTTLLPVLPALAITGIVAKVVKFIFTNYRERQADNFAIANSTVNELKGGRRFLMSVKSFSIRQRTTRWMKLFISSSGDNRLDFNHPSLTSRLNKIELSLKQRGVTINDLEEAPKIESLEDFWLSGRIGGAPS